MLRQKAIADFKYLPSKLQCGYADKILFIDLDKYHIEEKQVSEEIKSTFIGGKGYGLKFLWDAVNQNTKWNDHENEIVITTGPLSGLTQYPGAGRVIATTLSPLTEIPVDVNTGGYFGPYLKFSGWDGLEIRGKSEKDVIIFIDGNAGRVKIIDATLVKERDTHILAPHLIDKFSADDNDKKNISVLSSGRGAEHSKIGTINFSSYDVKHNKIRQRQTGRGGMGTVLRDKHILAVVIKYAGINNSLNNPYDIHKINELAIKLHREIATLNEDKILKTCGTANYIGLMNENELLPVKNMQYGSNPDAKNIDAGALYKKYQKQYSTDGCWFGCSIACKKVIDDFKLRTGPYAGRKVTIDGPDYEILASLGANCGVFNLEAILEMNFYCNTYGIDSVSYACIMAFLMECYERGIINDEFTGGHKLKFGNYRAMLSVLHEMADGRGLGIVAAIGIQGIKELLCEEYNEDIDFLNDIGLVQDGIEFGSYMSKESLAQQGSYGITNKSPQHDQCWMISMDKLKNSIPTVDAKAQALTIFPIFRTMFGIVGLCRLPWNNIIPLHLKNSPKHDGEIIKEHIEDYCLVYEAVTGSKMSLKEMMLASDRISTFQRLFNKRMGKGIRQFDMLPYRAMGPVTQSEYLSKQELYDAQIRNELGMSPDNFSLDKKIEILRDYRSKLYEELIDATYKIRGWDNNGVPTEEKIKSVGLGEEYLDYIKEK